MAHEATLGVLKGMLGAEAFTTSEFRDNFRIIVLPDRLYQTLETLKENCGFDMLVDVTAADYFYYPDARDRFGVVYALLNVATGERIYVKVFLNEPDLTIPSACPLWKGADWMEREVYDMYGIRFEGHPLFGDHADRPLAHRFSPLIEDHSAHLEFADSLAGRISNDGVQFRHYDARLPRSLCRLHIFDVDEPTVLLEAWQARAQKFLGRMSLRRRRGSVALRVEESEQSYQDGAGKQHTCE